MNLTCPACGAPFSADDVHVDVGIANCRVCRGVLDLRARDRPLQRPRPPRFAVDDGLDRLAIRWRWFRAAKLVMIPFTIFWCGFLAFWYAGATSGPHPAAAPVLLFPLLHVGVGVALLYGTVANLTNRTQIVADGERLTVAHGPLPWRGNRSLARADIAQLFCRRDTGSKGAISYALVAVKADGTRVDLVRGMEREDEVRWLEEALEKRLGIVNRPVVGEVA